MNDPQSAEWYYVGHYGQLGPLTLEQMSDLSRDGVVGPDTFVWRPGQREWRPARDFAELHPYLPEAEAALTPPPPPVMASPSSAAGAPSPSPRLEAGPWTTSYPPLWSRIEASIPRSDKRRTVAALLNLIPGVGRFYLGYAAHGALQLITTALCGVGYLWSVLDGLYILAGGVRYDGYGRRLED